MKKYVYEASKKQLEKPTEPKYVFCATAKVTVYAETEAEAYNKAEIKLHQIHDGSGAVLGKARFVRCDDLPVDWSYGYGDDRRSGATESIGDLVGNHMIR